MLRFIKTVSHSPLFCTVLVLPSLSRLGSQQPVDPHHSTECINRTKYTVGTVGISELFCSVPGLPAPPPRGYFASLNSAQPSSVRRGLRGLFSSASESHCVVSAFPMGESGSAVRPRRNSVCSSKRLALKTRQWVQTHIEPGPASAAARFSLPPHG